MESISSLDEGKGSVKVVVTANATGKQGLGATKIVHFTLPDSTPDSKLFHSFDSFYFISRSLETQHMGPNMYNL